MPNRGTSISCLTMSVVAALGLALAVCDNAAADLNEGLVGYWSFDEGEGGTAYDYSGNGHDGTIYGTAWTGGVSGSALYYDGLNAYVVVPDSASIEITPDISISLWVTVGSFVSEEHPCLVTRYNAGDQDRVWRMWIHGGTGQVGFYADDNGDDCTPSYTIYSNASLSTDTWYHITATKSGTSGSIFIDGALDAQENDCPATIDVTEDEPIRMGRRNDGATIHYFDGIIDEVRIYDRALSHDEILDLYWSTTHPDPQDDTTDGDKSDVSGTSSDPVNTATGSFFHQETDLSIPSRGSPLVFTRFYNSKAAASAAKAGKSGQASAKSKQAPPKRKTATSQPASTKDRERPSADAKKHGESSAGKAQEQAAGSSKPQPQAKEKTK